MKKKLVAQILILSLVVGCAVEPPVTFYRFKIINKTKTILYVESKQDNNIKFCFDTLKQNQVHVEEIPNYCFVDYQDTLINYFFLKLTVKPLDGTLNIDPYERNNWTDSLDLNGSSSCSGGFVYYTLIINGKDIK